MDESVREKKTVLPSFALWNHPERRARGISAIAG